MKEQATLPDPQAAVSYYALHTSLGSGRNLPQQQLPCFRSFKLVISTSDCPYKAPLLLINLKESHVVIVNFKIFHTL